MSSTAPNSSNANGSKKSETNSSANEPQMPDFLKAALVRSPSPETKKKEEEKAAMFGPVEQNFPTAEKPYITMRNGSETATAEGPVVAEMKDVVGGERGPVSEENVRADFWDGEGEGEGEGEGKGEAEREK